MERQKNKQEFRNPFHLVRCFGQLAIMYANEKYRAFESMMEDAEDVWGDEAWD